MRTTLAVPLVNAAGTAGKNLENQVRAVRNSARELLDTLNLAAPRECDYLGHPRPLEWERAVQEHIERCRMANKLRNDFDVILLEIENQSRHQEQNQTLASAQKSRQEHGQSYGRRG